MAKVVSVPAGSQANSMAQQHHLGAMGHMHTQLTKSLERILEEAHLSGELKLSGRKLKDFPRTGGKYDLTDTVIADLSKNKFWELPQEVLEFLFVEKLHLYHNALRSLPEGLGCLQSLRFLDLSRNQLCSLPEGLCHLHSLEVLLVANNKLSSLPDDIGNLKSLMELDASCNEITHLPRSLGRLKNLKAVDLRKNLLIELPLELTYLKLASLDMSENRLSTLPVELRLMSTLERLRLDGNPLMAPPAVLVARGRVHIFKFLETQAAAQERRRVGDAGRSTLRKTLLPDLRAKRHTVDSGYSTSDGGDVKWSYESLGGEDGRRSRTNHIPGNETEDRSDSPVSSSDGLSKSTLSLDQLEAKRLILLQSNDRAPIRPTHMTNGSNGVGGHRSPIERNGQSDEKRPLEHIQTYREYKEALRQQRAPQQTDVYRPRGDGSGLSPVEATERPIQKVPPSRIINGDQPLTNGNTTPNGNTNGNATNGGTNGNTNTNGIDYVKPLSPAAGRQRQVSPRPIKWSKDVVSADKLSFTMRREFERAKEEAELISQLRHNIESRLRMTLPDDLGSALTDGVVLCHLANHVRPRSVASIHVPSPAVPKLSMARCRRNVDNFLEACRKIGVEEDELCTVDDVVSSFDVAAVLQTVHRLLHPGPRTPPPKSPSPTHLHTGGPNSATLLAIFIAVCIALYFLPHEE